MHKLESQKDQLNPASVLVVSDLDDEGILQGPECFFMELNIHIPGPRVREKEEKSRGKKRATIRPAKEAKSADQQQHKYCKIATKHKCYRIPTPGESFLGPMLTRNTQIKGILGNVVQPNQLGTEPAHLFYVKRVCFRY